MIEPSQKFTWQLNCLDAAVTDLLLAFFDQQPSTILAPARLMAAQRVMSSLRLIVPFF
jgi:hypothetical protein